MLVTEAHLIGYGMLKVFMLSLSWWAIFGLQMRNGNWATI